MFKTTQQMKKTDWILIISTLLYSFLFYKQSSGINFLLFNAAILMFLIIRNKELLYEKTWLYVATCSLVSSFFIFRYSSPLALVANLFSLAVISAISIKPKTSFISSIIHTLYSAGSSFVFMFLDWTERSLKKVPGEYHRPLYVILLLVMIPLVITFLFFLMYQSASPLFYDLTKNINFNWISFYWIFFTLGGLLLLYGFFYNHRAPIIAQAEENALLTLTEEYVSQKGFLNKFMRIDTEILSGIILFSLLNGLLLIVNVLDLRFLWFDGTLPEGIKHKEFVHDGIGILISSILIAILIILFYFRGSINFYQKNKWIKWMTFFWIIQNAFMIFSTCYRNNMYIQESGLSYKKIGVFVYLLLTLIGLFLTYIKVIKKKSNWFLFRTNATICFFLLVLSCLFNWDVIITNYNIMKHDKEGKKLEKYFLLDLSFKNLPELLSLPDSVSSTDDLEARDYYYELRGIYFSDFKSCLHKKLFTFLSEMQTMEWKSACLEKTRVHRELLSMNTNIKELDLNNSGLKTLSCISIFPNIEELNLKGCNLEDLAEISLFKKIRKLDLSDNNINSIKKFPSLVSLSVLNLSGNNISDFSSLYRLKNLNELTVFNITTDQLEKLKTNLPNTKIINHFDPVSK